MLNVWQKINLKNGRKQASGEKYIRWQKFGFKRNLWPKNVNQINVDEKNFSEKIS